jgi:hypothetical protein
MLQSRLPDQSIRHSPIEDGHSAIPVAQEFSPILKAFNLLSISIHVDEKVGLGCQRRP